MLCLDLTDKSYELESLKNRLERELQEKYDLIKKYEKALQEKDRKILERTAQLKDAEKKIQILTNYENEYKIEIENLTKKKDELYEQLPKKTLASEDIKNIPLKTKTKRRKINLGKNARQRQYESRSKK